MFIDQNWIEIFKNIKYSNGATCICSAISIALFAGVRDNINERFKGRMPIPVPIELIVVRHNETKAFEEFISHSYGSKNVSDISY